MENRKSAPAQHKAFQYNTTLYIQNNYKGKVFKGALLIYSNYRVL